MEKNIKTDAGNNTKTVEKQKTEQKTKTNDKEIKDLGKETEMQEVPKTELEAPKMWNSNDKVPSDDWIYAFQDDGGGGIIWQSF